ncbi:MAG: hypothetical protein ACOVP1_13580 [Bacteroidia bacterium]
MSIVAEILSNKNLKAKQQTDALVDCLMNQHTTTNELIEIASIQKDIPKANCIEALENCTKTHPQFCNEDAFNFVIAQLKSNTPRVKWESARVIGNTVALFPQHAQIAAEALLKNTNDTGTVVRWSAAFALGEIIQLNLAVNQKIIPLIEEIILKEEKNSIRKIYQTAIKKAKVF